MILNNVVRNRYRIFHSNIQILDYVFDFYPADISISKFPNDFLSYTLKDKHICSSLVFFKLHFKIRTVCQINMYRNKNFLKRMSATLKIMAIIKTMNIHISEKIAICIYNYPLTILTLIIYLAYLAKQSKA